MKIYLSGPMTGLPEFNYPRFNEVAAKLRGRGHIVYNPAEYEYDGIFPVRKAFKDYTAWICDHADGVCMLEGWKDSKGATAEHALAVALNLSIWYGFVLDSLSDNDYLTNITKRE